MSGVLEFSAKRFLPIQRQARRRWPQRQTLIDCLAAIMRERNSNSGTARRAAAEGGALRASLTSNSSRAPLRHANNEGTRPKYLRVGTWFRPTRPEAAS